MNTVQHTYTHTHTRKHLLIGTMTFFSKVPRQPGTTQDWLIGIFFITLVIGNCVFLSRKHSFIGNWPLFVFRFFINFVIGNCVFLSRKHWFIGNWPLCVFRFANSWLGGTVCFILNLPSLSECVMGFQNTWLLDGNLAFYAMICWWIYLHKCKLMLMVGL